jgi:hypothetical protein
MDMQVAALDILTTKGRLAPEAARAIGEAMDLQIARSHEELATRQQLNETNASVENVRTTLKTDIAALDAKIESVRLELKCDIAALEVKLERVKSEILRWMFLALTSQAAVFFAMVRLSMPRGP